MVLKEVLPRKGLLYQEDNMPLALCRPKLMPLKSVTLEKLEEMHKTTIEKSLQQQESQDASSLDHGSGVTNQMILH